MAVIMMLAGLPAVGGEPLTIFTTVAPVAGLIEAVGGDAVDARAAIPSGGNPHDYQPTPGEIRAMSRADAYFLTGMWFEQQAILPVLERAGTPAVEIGRAIPRLTLAGEAIREDDPEHRHHASGLDQHVWMTPGNAAVLIRDIARELSLLAPDRAAEFQANADRAAAEFQALAREFAEDFAGHEGRAFYVYHPSFGYFAAEYRLRELAIEKDGKSPTPRQLREIIEQARRDRVGTVIVQPQYNPAPARAVAQAIGGEAVEIDPLAPDLETSLKQLRDVLVEGFER